MVLKVQIFSTRRCVFGRIIPEGSEGFDAFGLRVKECVVITTQRPDLPAYTNCDVQLQNFAPVDGLNSPKHVEHLMINKDTL